MNQLTEKEQIHKSAELCRQFNETVNWILSAQEELSTPKEDKESARLNYYREHDISIGMGLIYSLCLYFCVALFHIFSGIIINKAYITFDILLILIPIVVQIVRKIKRRSAFDKYWIQQTNEFNKGKEELQKKVDSMMEIYEDLFERVHDKSICIIPDRYIEVAEYIDNLITDCRADTLKEAINVYEQDCHNMRMQQEIRNQTAKIQEEISWQARLRDWDTDSIKDSLKDINRKLGD